MDLLLPERRNVDRCPEGYYQILLNNGMRFVILSEPGYQIFQKSSKVLEDTGYFKNRVSLFNISQFYFYEDYEQLAGEIRPESMVVIKHFLDWVGIKPGMRVLELCCGSGPFAFEGEGIEGNPLSGMLARAKAKHHGGRYPWVEFRQARTENLPVENGSFDATLGVVFLHFTDRQGALREMRRVSKPGGAVASCHPLKYDYDVPFFQEWFRPIFELAARCRVTPKNYLMPPDDAPKAFEMADLIQIEVENFGFPMVFHDPEKVVTHFIYSVGLFQKEVADLPWKAREELIEVLRESDDRVYQKYPLDVMAIHVPNQNVKGKEGLLKCVRAGRRP